MDGIELLGRAMLAGLRVSIDGGTLVLKGPKHLAPIAAQLLDRKAEVIRAVRTNYMGADNLGRRVFNFAAAQTRDAATGMKRRTQDEIEVLLAVCETCPFFKDGLCNHKKCGCNVSGKQVWLNKLAWKSTSCPIGAWPDLPDECVAT